MNESIKEAIANGRQFTFLNSADAQFQILAYNINKAGASLSRAATVFLSDLKGVKS